MAPADEALLERIAVDPQAVTSDERRRAERLVAAHPEARALLEFFRAFHRDAAAARPPTEGRRQEGRSPGEKQKRPLPPRFELHRLRPAGRTGGPSVLAASTSDDNRRYKTMAVFASEVEHVVLRVVHDRQGACYHFQLLTPEMEGRDSAVLTFEEIDLHVVTDLHGGAVVHEDEIMGGRATMEQLPTPLVRLQVAASQPVEEDGSHRETLPTGHELHLVRRRGAVSFTLRAPADSIPLRLAVVSVGEEKVVVPFDGIGETVDALSEKGPLVAYFYQ